MKYQYLKKLALGLLILSVATVSCKKEEEPVPANELGRVGAAEVTVIEGDGQSPVTVTFAFAIEARKAGSATFTAVTDNLTYGTNYTTDPAEAGGSVTVDFTAGQKNVTFDIIVIDDQANLPDGSVTYTLSEISGETSDISGTASTFKLTIQDNEGESITPESAETVQFGDVVPGTASDAQEVKFTTINVVSDITAEASAGFQVANTVDGTYGNTATLAFDATSVFVKAAPDAGAALGETTGTVTLTVAEASATVNLRAIVAATVGQLFWVENFEYPSDDTYPPYADTYPASYNPDPAIGQLNWGIVPVSARYRLAAVYNGDDATVDKITGLARTGVFDTWYTQIRLRSVAMGDGPLSITGYPESGVGRTARLALDYSNQSQKANCNNEGAFLSKNTAMARRFVDDGSEITSGNVFFTAMVKVNSLADEATPVLKNAVFMLTGDAAFVNENAMKLNIQADGSGGFNFGVSKSGDDGSVVYVSTSYAVGTTYAVVLKVEINEDLEGEDPNDAVSVYVFAEGETIPTFETIDLTPEARVDATNQDIADVHDVTSGLEIFYFREVADIFAAGGVANLAIHDVEFSGIRVGTSWSALFQDASQALYDSQSEDALQTRMYGQPGCPTGPPTKIGNKDL